MKLSCAENTCSTVMKGVTQNALARANSSVTGFAGEPTGCGVFRAVEALGQKLEPTSAHCR